MMIMFFPIPSLLTYCSILIFRTGKKNHYEHRMSVCHYLIEGFFVDSVKLPSRSVREHDRPYLLSNNLHYQEPKVGEGINNSEFV